MQKLNVVTAIIFISLFAFIGCQKKEDKKEDPPPAAVVIAPGSGGSTISPGSIMLTIDVSCGGEPCIKDEVSLSLDGADDGGSGESFVQTIRGFYWLITGFADETAYKSFIDDEAKQSVIPQSGFVGRIEEVRSHVVTTVLANVSGITTCTDVPTSGSFEVAGDGTYTFAAAKNLAPASYPKSGIYDKRIEFAGVDFDASFEFFCSYAGMMVKFAPKGDGESIEYAFFYDRENHADGHFEFYLYDAGGFLGEAKFTLGLKVNVLPETFKIWMTQSQVSGSSYGGYRALGHTTSESQETSLWYQDLHGSGLTASTWASTAAVSDDSVSTGVAPNGGEQTSARQGCAENFSIQANTITSNALCPGLALTAAGAPAVHADGDWSMAWFEANLAAKLNAL